MDFSYFVPRTKQTHKLTAGVGIIKNLQFSIYTIDIILGRLFKPMWHLD